MDLIMVFNEKIDILELYNCAVHQCYIIYSQHIEILNLINCPIHFQYISIHFLYWQFLFLNLFGTFSINLKMVFSQKIGLLELYNFAVYLIHITWWNHTEKYISKKFSIHFPYILMLTSPSPSVFEE